MSSSLTLRLLNGDQILMPFDQSHITVLDLFIAIWKECGIGMNHLVLEGHDDDDDKNDQNILVLSGVHNDYGYSDRHWFDKKSQPWMGALRVFDLGQFGVCSVLSAPKRRQLVLYCRTIEDKPKIDKNLTQSIYKIMRTHVMCLDLNNLSFHRPCSGLSVEYSEGWGWKPSSKEALVNDDFSLIDVESFISFGKAFDNPDMFRPGPRVHESTGDRIDDFIIQYFLMSGYQPSWKCKVSRRNFSVQPILSSGVLS